MSIDVAKKEELRLERLDAYWSSDLKDVFNDIAERYDSANDFFSFGLWNFFRRRFVKRVKATQGAKVLDVCAGTNAVGIDLLLANPTLEVTAIDRSEGMQRIGATRAHDKGLQIKSIIADVHTLPFDDDTFDIVTLEAATRHLEVKRVFAEIHRVLKPGGHFYHHDLVKPANPVIAFLYYNYLRLMIPITTLTFYRKNEFLGMRKRALKLSAYFIEAINIFYTANELSTLMREAGFENVTAKSWVAGTVAAHDGKK